MGLTALGFVTLVEIVMVTGIVSQLLSLEVATSFFWAYALWAGTISATALLLMTQVYLNESVSQRLIWRLDYIFGWKRIINEILETGKVLTPTVTLAFALFELWMIFKPAANVIGLSGITGIIVVLLTSASLIIFKAYIFCKAYSSEWK